MEFSGRVSHNARRSEGPVAATASGDVSARVHVASCQALNTEQANSGNQQSSAALVSADSTTTVNVSATVYTCQGAAIAPIVARAGGHRDRGALDHKATGPNHCPNSRTRTASYCRAHPVEQASAGFKAMMSGNVDGDRPQPIGAHEIAIRLVCVGNRDSERLLGWTREVCQPAELKLGGGAAGPYVLSLDRRDAFVLFAGHDPRRLSALLRDVKPQLRSRVVIGLVTDSRPQSRAAMLRAGFDEVVDIDREKAAEGIARFRAIWRRQCMRKAAAEEQERRARVLGEICRDGAFTDREKRLIECLLERPGRCVPLQRLRCIAGDGPEPVSPISLRVSMSNLRRKLSDGIWIKAMPQEGYMLKRLPIAPADVKQQGHSAVGKAMMKRAPRSVFSARIVPPRSRMMP